MHDHLLVFVPGIMGTELRYVGEGEGGGLDDSCVWGGHVADLIDTLCSHPERLGRDLVPGNLIEHIDLPVPRAVYATLLKYLKRELGYVEGADFLPFPYDWRLDSRLNARKLTSFLREQLKEQPRSLKLVAHSMGGLICRHMLGETSNDDIIKNTKVLITIGTPVLGSSLAFKTLRKEPSLSWLADLAVCIFQRVDLTLRPKLLECLRDMQSIYQLLPPKEEQILVRGTGKRYSAMDLEVWPVRSNPMVQDAQLFHQEIERPIGTCVYTIYSGEYETVQDFRIDQDFQIIKEIHSGVIGDGTVCVNSAIHHSVLGNRIEITSGNTEHVGLPNNRSVLNHLADILSQ